MSGLDMSVPKGRLPLAKIFLKAGAVRVVSSAVSLALAIFLARWLGPGGYGVYSFALALLSFAILIGQLGFADLTVREVARFLEQGRSRLLGGYLRYSRRFVLGFSTTLSLLAFGVLLAVGDRYTHWPVLAVGLPLIVFFALGAHYQAVLKGAGYIILGILAHQLYRPAAFLGLVLAAAAAGAAPTPGLVMVLHTVAAGGVLVAVAWLSRRLLRAPAVARVARARTRLWTLSAVTFTGVAVVRLINQKFDIIAIGLLTNETDVGYYTVASQVSLTAAAILQVTASVISPKISQLSVEGDMVRIESMCRESARYSLTTALAVFLLVALWGKPLISALFGADYAAAASVTIILVGGQVLNAFFGPVGVLLNMRGQERLTFAATFVASVLNVTLNLLLIPRLGFEGAALGTVVAMTLWNVVLWAWAWRLWGINSSALSWTRQRSEPSSP